MQSRILVEGLDGRGGMGGFVTVPISVGSKRKPLRRHRHRNCFVLKWCKRSGLGMTDEEGRGKLFMVFNPPVVFPRMMFIPPLSATCALAGVLLMKRTRIFCIGAAVLALGGMPAAWAAPLDDDDAKALDAPVALLQDDDKAPVRPLTEGPLHEAFLSPAKDADPERLEKPPPP